MKHTFLPVKKTFKKPFKFVNVMWYFFRFIAHLGMIFENKKTLSVNNSKKKKLGVSTKQ